MAAVRDRAKFAVQNDLKWKRLDMGHRHVGTMTEDGPSVSDFEDRIEAVAADVEDAATEDDLDDVEDTIEELTDDIEATEFEPVMPELDEDEDEADVEPEDPAEDLLEELSDLQDDVDEQRGPYAEDVIAEVEDAIDTITDSEWAKEGIDEVTKAVEEFANTIPLDVDADEPLDSQEAKGVLEMAIETIEDADLNPDGDATTIATLLENCEELDDDIDEATLWTDLAVREQLRRQGFYDVLDHRKDFPPELNAIKVYEKRGEPEPILEALDLFDTDFMVGHCMDALIRMGSEDALEALEDVAGRRNVEAFAAIGTIGSEEGVDTLLDDIDGGREQELIVVRALGHIGSDEATEPVAEKLLTAEDTEIRSVAARALGMIGDTRAIPVLEEVLEDDDTTNTVRASAAWALIQIGTESALETAREYQDDASFIVQAEADKATRALEA